MKNVVGIKIENYPKKYAFISNDLTVKKGDVVIIETETGLQVGKIVTCVQKYADKDVSATMDKVVRLAQAEDLKQLDQNEQDSKVALKMAKQLAVELALPMQFLDANYTFDRKQLFFSYLADTRIDFRTLAKKLAAKYKTRIELRQIGVRDKAKKVGGIGPCGLILCCNQFLEDFVPVSINMAKNQDLALNPTKINGLCGRLLCCLNYEDELYKESRHQLPEIGKVINVEQGTGKVVAVNILTKTYQVELENKDIITVSV